MRRREKDARRREKDVRGKERDVRRQKDVRRQAQQLHLQAEAAGPLGTAGLRRTPWLMRHLLGLTGGICCLSLLLPSSWQPALASHTARCAHLCCSRACPGQGQLCQGREHPGMLQMDQPPCRDGAGTSAPKHTRAPL